MNINKIREAAGKIWLNATSHGTEEPYATLSKIILAELYKAPKVLTDEEIEKLRLSREREDGRRASSKYGYGFADGLRYARDNGYLAPSAGLTVDEAEECLESLIEDGDDHAKERQRKLLCEMMKDDAKSGLYDTGERPPLLSDEDVKRIALGYFTPEYVQKSRVAQDLYNASYVAIHKALEICEAARAKDAELIQRLVDALKGLVFLEFCNEEGLSSGAPTSRDWKLAFDKAQEQIDAAAEAGFKPSDY